MSISSVDATISYWVAHGVPYLPGVSDDELLAFEDKHDVTLPADVRSFFKATNGTRVPLNPGWDHDYFEFWPLSEIVPDSDFAWAMNFADYQMLSWWYAIDLTGSGGLAPGTVYLLGTRDGKPQVAARSFTEFLDLYVAGSERLWPNGAGEAVS